MLPFIATPLSTSRTSSAQSLSQIEGASTARSASPVELAHPESVFRIEEALAGTYMGAEVMMPSAEFIPLLENVHSKLDAANADLLGGLHGSQLRAAEQLQVGITKLLEGDEAQALLATRGTDAHPLMTDLVTRLDETRREQPAASQGVVERAKVIFDGIGTYLRNDFDPNQSAAGRWMANAVGVGVRTGMIVGVVTTMRQLVGFTIEKAYQQEAVTMPPRVAAGVAAMLIGPGLNIAGFIRDECNHTATNSSRLARVAMLALSAGGLVATAAANPPQVLGGMMGVFGPQVLTYTMARDLAQLFFPMHDNAGVNALGTAAATGLYAGAQYATGEMMDLTAAQSGPGYVMGTAARARATPPTTMAPPAVPAPTSFVTRMMNWALGSEGATTASPVNSKAAAQAHVATAMEHLSPNLAHDVTRGVLNAAAEVFDDLQRPGLMRHFEVQQRIAKTHAEAVRSGADPAAAVRALPAEQTEGLRVGLDRPRIGAGHWPTSTQVANQFLTTNGGRTSLFQTIMGSVMSVASALDSTGLSSAAQGHVLNAVAAGVIAVNYGPFIYMHTQRSPAAETDPEAGEPAHAAALDRTASEDSIDWLLEENGQRSADSTENNIPMRRMRR